MNKAVPFCQKGNIVPVACNPGDKNLWFRDYNLVNPVQSNIRNGCWMTNFEPMQKTNNKLCDRYLHNINYKPCTYENVMNTMLNMRKRNYKMHP